MTAKSPLFPTRVLPAAASLPLFDVAGSRAVEAHELAARGAGVLMPLAGASVARLALAHAPHAKRVWVAAGPGGNGGDGLHAAAHLCRAGREVVITLLAERGRLSPDALAGLQRAEHAGADIRSTVPEGHFDLVIDALLGIGTGREPAGELAAAVGALNSAGAPCIAVDVPSGLDADTGMPCGRAAVQADITLSLLTLKPGLFTAQGRDCAGAIWFDPLGSEAAAQHSVGANCVARLAGAADWRAAAAPRGHAQHKGSFGDVFVVGGAPGMQGAARLAAHAALAAGAGRTVVSLLDPHAATGDESRPEWLWRSAAWLPGMAALEQSTVVCGCGGGSEVRAVLPALLSRSARLVLDADALNAIAADTALQKLLTARAARGLATVLTPHPLEAARLLNSTTAAVQSGRLAAAAEVAQRWRVTVALKGSGTVIAAPGALPVINSTGSAALATGGTGDVLAGWIGGLWSQLAGRLGDETGVRAAAVAAEDATRCAVAAVWLHGLAGERCGAVAVRARELVDAMRALAAGLTR